MTGEEGRRREKGWGEGERLDGLEGWKGRREGWEGRWEGWEGRWELLPGTEGSRNEDGGEGDEAEGEGVVEVADDGGGADACEAGGHQQLRAVRDQPLDKAGEGVKDAGDALPVKAEAVADILGYAADGDDGDGVVGRAEVGEADECGDAELGTAPLPAGLPVIAGNGGRRGGCIS